MRLTLYIARHSIVHCLGYGKHTAPILITIHEFNTPSHHCGSVECLLKSGITWQEIKFHVRIHRTRIFFNGKFLL